MNDTSASACASPGNEGADGGEFFRRASGADRRQQAVEAAGGHRRFIAQVLHYLGDQPAVFGADRNLFAVEFDRVPGD
jgi:hypothetical protein